MLQAYAQLTLIEKANLAVAFNHGNIVASLTKDAEFGGQVPTVEVTESRFKPGFYKSTALTRCPMERLFAEIR
jgi:hypothetical protein